MKENHVKGKNAASRKNVEERFSLTPKGLFLSALIDVGIIEDVFDRKANAAFELFEARMKRFGYVTESEAK